MARKANPAEERVLQSLRQTNVITKAKMDECIALLEATEACDKCGGDGRTLALLGPWPQSTGKRGGTGKRPGSA